MPTGAAFRPAGRTDVTSANRLTFKTLARRILELDDDIRALDALLIPLVAETAPEMIEGLGVGTETAGALLVAAGENSNRIRRRSQQRTALCILSRHYRRIIVIGHCLSLQRDSTTRNPACQASSVTPLI